MHAANNYNKQEDQMSLKQTIILVVSDLQVIQGR